MCVCVSACVRLLTWVYGRSELTVSVQTLGESWEVGSTLVG